MHNCLPACAGETWVVPSPLQHGQTAAHLCLSQDADLDKMSAMAQYSASELDENLIATGSIVITRANC